jgi:G:T-mismatch repair DNA endonuclease (very short patch repair protein)
MARDKNKIKELKSKGWICIVIWECEIKKNVSNVVKKLKKNYANCFSNGIFHE